MGAAAEQASHTATRTSTPGTPHSAVEARRSTSDQAPEDDVTRLDPQRSITLLGLVAPMVGALGFDLDVGFTALTIAVALTLVSPSSAKGAVEKISWGTVLLIGGIVTYVTLLQNQGVVGWLGDGVADVGAPLVAAVLICLIGAVVSAVALIAALAISSSLVDCSPFSTNGALVVANADPDQREMVFKRLMQWGMSIVVIAPVVAWATLVVPTA